MEELEAKLVAGADVVVPDLTAVVAGAEPDVPEERTLFARYLDSDDLRLARAGATLRHREGAWQVKLPLGAVDAATLRRAELRFPGAEDAPPAEALAAVAALLGGAALRPVATGRTVRRRVLLRRDDGIVAEVGDDDVEAAGAGGEPVRWRELEVEAGPCGGLAEVTALVAALEAAGARTAAAEPKVHAVLGEAARRPPAHAAPARPPAAGDLAAALAHADADLVAADVRYRATGAARHLAAALARLRALAVVAGDAGAAEATRALVIPLASLEPEVRELADRQAAVAGRA
ncbi:MAG: CYTH domain-containing protein, partial [Actinomycetota bacterium]